MKKYTKTIVAVSIMAVLLLAYFFYLANRTPTNDATQQAVKDENLAALTTRNIAANYPESPKEVVRLYARITEAYYASGTSTEQVEQLGKQARILFDDELKSGQTEVQFLEALQKDVEAYHSIGRYISRFDIEGSNDVKYTTFQEREYASINLVYYIRDNANLQYSYTRFILRKDIEGKWKILYWELISPEEMAQ